MTDDLRPKHDWKAIIGTVVVAGGMAWGIAKWAAQTPTRDEFNQQRDDMIRVRLELPTINARIERVDGKTDRMEKTLERIEAKQDEAQRRRR